MSPTRGHKTPDSAPRLIRRLEAELRKVKREQARLIERLERSRHELNEAHEEVSSTNEELQSTNEELLNSQQELQSTNEQLITLNAQLRDRVHELTTVNDDLANLLVSTDIATVFLDTDLHIKRYTTAATHLLNLLPSDVGRSITHMATNLVNVDLGRDARFVLDSVVPVGKEVAAQDGRQYVLRLLPYRTEDGHVQGVVLTFVDVTALKTTEYELRDARDDLALLNHTLEQRVAERTKWLALMHTVTRVINEAPTWDEALHLVLRRICESEKWQMGYVYLPDKDAPDHVSPVISCFEDERFTPFHLVAKEQRYARGESLPGRVYAEGVPLWVNTQEELVRLAPIRGEAAKHVGLIAAAALPVAIGQEVMAVLEFFSNRPHEPSEELGNLMNDVSTQIGRVLERERLTAQVADLVWREQQELLHTLHDSLGQTLTGLGMLSAALGQRLTGKDPAAVESAQQIARQAQEALEQVRRLSRGLFPVEVDNESFVPALRQLASTTESLHKVHVRVESAVETPIDDTRVATQLYRIAQEAVTNAVKHAKPRTIRIQISTDSALTKLRVVDDGLGIQDTVTKHEGVGLRIMNFRATSIGALLSVGLGNDGGTAVTCTLRNVPLPTVSGTV